MGKTTFALNIVRNNLFKDKTVLVFSLEMTNEQLIKKMISADAEIHMQSFLTGASQMMSGKSLISLLLSSMINIFIATMSPRSQLKL